MKKPGGEKEITRPRIAKLRRRKWSIPFRSDSAASTGKLRSAPSPSPQRSRNPTWVVPDDIYQEHLERDGEADHIVKGGDEDNPLGLFKLDLSIPEYGIHGTNVPWGVGMEVSHGCIRLYPEDIERLFHKVKVGTPGEIVYQPVKFGWRGDALYVEVHDDLYGKYPGLWNYAMHEVQRKGLEDQVDLKKLELAVIAKNGVPTYVMVGPPPDAGATTASSDAPS